MNELEFLSSLIKKSLAKGANHADALIASTTSLDIGCRLSKLETIERSETKGFSLRVIIGKKQAIISSDRFEILETDKLIDRALDMAKVSTDEPYIALADSSMLVKNVKDLDLRDEYDPSPEELLKLSIEAENQALEVKNISNSNGSGYSYNKTRFALATSNDFIQQLSTSAYSNYVSVIAEKNGNKETDYAASNARHFSDLQTAISLGQEAGIRCTKKLGSRKIPSGKLPAIFENKIASNILSNFASAINGSSIARQTSFLKDHLNKKIFNDDIKIIDDPHIIRGLASTPFDSEGIEGYRKLIVEDGILNSWLLDIRSANQLGMKTTANARRSLGSAPYPSSTNFYMQPGKLSPEELIKQIKNGVYITDLLGHGVNLINGDFSQGISGFYIENGEIAFPISEVTISGNLLEMFKSLTPANDLKFCYSTNSPTLLIEGMTIAGI